MFEIFESKTMSDCDPCKWKQMMNFKLSEMRVKKKLTHLSSWLRIQFSLRHEQKTNMWTLAPPASFNSWTHEIRLAAVQKSQGQTIHALLGILIHTFIFSTRSSTDYHGPPKLGCRRPNQKKLGEKREKDASICIHFKGNDNNKGRWQISERDEILESKL